MPLRRRTLAIFLAALAAAAGACSEPQPIRIGLVTGLTGRHYDLGLSSRNGVELAVSEVNAAGGVKGRKIELLIRDDGQDAEQARRAVNDLVGAGVVAIIGHATSAMAEATLPIVNRDRVLMVSPTVSSAAFEGKDDWFVMMQSSTTGSARMLSAYLVSHRIARSVSVVYDLSNLSYTKAWYDTFHAAFEGAGRTVRPVTFTSGRVRSMRDLAASALSGGADAVLIIANALDTAALAQQLRLLSSAVPLLGAEWGFTNDVVVNGGRAVEGAVFTQKVNLADETPRFQVFRRGYEARYSRSVDFAAVFAYETVKLLGAALEQDATREGVRAAVLRLGAFEGLQGTVRINEHGDAERRPYVMTIRGGRVVPVE